MGLLVYKRASVQLVLLLLSITVATGEILYWRHTSDWDDPANWNQSRVPCSAETVVFNTLKTFSPKPLPDTFEIRITADVTLKKLVIPLGGTFTLKRGVKISLSTASTCEGQGLGLVTDKSVNSFIGVMPHSWNCANNWRKSDGTSPSKPPCQDDSVVFQVKSSWIQLSTHAKVGRLAWEGQSVDGLSDISNYEKYFYKSTQSADLTVEPACLQGMPQLCPCQSSGCSFSTTILPTAGVSKSSSPSASKSLSPLVSKSLPTLFPSISTTPSAVDSGKATAVKSLSSSQIVDITSVGKVKATSTTLTLQPTGRVSTAAFKPTSEVEMTMVMPTHHAPSVTPTRKIETVLVVPTKSHSPAVQTVEPTPTSASIVTEKPIFTEEITRKPLPVDTEKPTEVQQTDEPVPCDPELTLCPPVVCPQGTDCSGESDESSGSGSITWVGVGAGVGGAVVVVIVIIVVIVVLRRKRSGRQHRNAEITFLPYSIPKPQATVSSMDFDNPAYSTINPHFYSQEANTGSSKAPSTCLDDEYAAN